MPNALTGAWTNGEKAIFQDWWDTVCTGYHICQWCGQTAWTLYNFAMSEGAFLGLGVGVGPSKRVHAVIECDNCGATEHLNAQKIGMI